MWRVELLCELCACVCVTKFFIQNLAGPIPQEWPAELSYLELDRNQLGVLLQKCFRNWMKLSTFG